MSELPEPLLPLGLRLRERRVLVVGEPVALRRVAGLLARRAKVVLVSPVAVAVRWRLSAG